MAVCSKLGEFKHHDSEYYKLAKGHRAGIEELGCLYPCTYTEYRLRPDTYTLVRSII